MRKQSFYFLNKHRINVELTTTAIDDVDRKERVRITDQLCDAHTLCHGETVIYGCQLSLQNI
ncbi:hypothetical protein MtrunA17_Chr6g0472791 [Medicago truncatula]|uniref:Uncharacterized protein n=1 Tax=Medicago truncatula TaxID=3880 RepID=A0A396HEV1_MEDTR|nr:hypothetical protein MtrunA17_Chr6g0472791 [Medicago truncatula]